MLEVSKQLEHHIKKIDRDNAEKSGEEPWFEAFRRLAGEWGCSLRAVPATDLDSKGMHLAREEAASLRRRHTNAKPNPHGCDLPPVLFLDETKFYLIDGTNRVNFFLQSPDDGQPIDVIVVFKKSD